MLAGEVIRVRRFARCPDSLETLSVRASLFAQEYARMAKRFGFALVGGTVGALTGELLQRFGLPAILTAVLPFVGMAVAVYYGERTRRIATMEEVHRPLTLFGRDKQP